MGISKAAAPRDPGLRGCLSVKWEVVPTRKWLKVVKTHPICFAAVPNMTPNNIQADVAGNVFVEKICNGVGATLPKYYVAR